MPLPAREGDALLLDCCPPSPPPAEGVASAVPVALPPVLLAETVRVGEGWAVALPPPPPPTPGALLLLPQPETVGEKVGRVAVTGGDKERVGEAEAHTLREAEGQELTEGEGVEDTVPARPAAAPADALTLCEPCTVLEAVPLPLPLGLEEGLCPREAVAEPGALSVMVEEGVAEPAGERDTVGLGVALLPPLPVPERVTRGVGEALAPVPSGLRLPLWLACRGLAVASTAVRVAQPLVLPVWERVTAAEALGRAEALRLLSGEAEEVALPPPALPGELLASTLLLACSTPEGVPVGLLLLLADLVASSAGEEEGHTEAERVPAALPVGPPPSAQGVGVKLLPVLPEAGALALTPPCPCRPEGEAAEEGLPPPPTCSVLPVAEGLRGAVADTEVVPVGLPQPVTVALREGRGLALRLPAPEPVPVPLALAAAEALPLPEAEGAPLVLGERVAVEVPVEVSPGDREAGAERDRGAEGVGEEQALPAPAPAPCAAESVGVTEGRAVRVPVKLTLPVALRRREGDALGLREKVALGVWL